MFFFWHLWENLPYCPQSNNWGMLITWLAWFVQFHSPHPFCTEVSFYKSSDLLLWYWQTDLRTLFSYFLTLSAILKSSQVTFVYTLTFYIVKSSGLISLCRRLAVSLFRILASGTVSFIANIDHKCRENQIKFSLSDDMIWVVYLKLT